MFSREESAKLRQEFWTSFGKSFPRKWLLYNTRIKGLSLKFAADRKKAAVCLDLENNKAIVNELLFEQLLSLKKILVENHLPDVIYDPVFELDNGKVLHRIYVPYGQKFSIHNKNTWRDCYEFFVATMSEFKTFYLEYESYIKRAIQ